MTLQIQSGRIAKQVTEPVTRWVDVATETSDDYARLAPVALRLLGEDQAKVAVIGLGFGVLPRLICRYHLVTAYEIEPEIVDEFRRRSPWASAEVGCVVGDYQRTLIEQYNWIVWDIVGEPPDWLHRLGTVIVP